MNTRFRASKKITALVISMMMVIDRFVDVKRPYLPLKQVITTA